MQQPIPLYAFTIKFSQRVRVACYGNLGCRNLPPTTLKHRTFDGDMGYWRNNLGYLPKRLLMLWTLRLLVLQRTQTANGEREASVYIVDLYLPNKVVLKGQPVIDGLLAGADVLVGMDVIGKGDFAVTHQGNGTCMTFQLPSSNHIDFVEAINQTKPRKGFRQPKKRKHGKRNRG